MAWHRHGKISLISNDALDSMYERVLGLFATAAIFAKKRVRRKIWQDLLLAVMSIPSEIKQNT